MEVRGKVAGEKEGGGREAGKKRKGKGEKSDEEGVGGQERYPQVLVRTEWPGRGRRAAGLQDRDGIGTVTARGTQQVRLTSDGCLRAPNAASRAARDAQTSRLWRLPGNASALLRFCVLPGTCCRVAPSRDLILAPHPRCVAVRLPGSGDTCPATAARRSQRHFRPESIKSVAACRLPPPRISTTLDFGRLCYRESCLAPGAVCSSALFVCLVTSGMIEQ